MCWVARSTPSGFSHQPLHTFHTAGVYTLADLRHFGRKAGWCPYFLARHMMSFANVVVYNYQYMIDPKVSQMVSVKWASGLASVGRQVLESLG